MPCWRIVLSTFHRCMSFHTAWVKTGKAQIEHKFSGSPPKADSDLHINESPSLERKRSWRRSPPGFPPSILKLRLRVREGRGVTVHPNASGIRDSCDDGPAPGHVGARGIMHLIDTADALAVFDNVIVRSRKRATVRGRRDEGKGNHSGLLDATRYPRSIGFGRLASSRGDGLVEGRRPSNSLARSESFGWSSTRGPVNSLLTILGL